MSSITPRGYTLWHLQTYIERIVLFKELENASFPYRILSPHFDGFF